MAKGWLFKTEPSVYSFQELVKEKKTVWDGVKNNLALKHLSNVKKGDRIIVYHTGDEKAAVGIAEATSGAYPDPGKKDPKLLVVDIKPIEAFPRSVTLAEVKSNAKLKNFDLARLPRLSIMPVSEEQWAILREMAGG